ncbi:HAD-superfamily phosphatase, subfamily IIIC/FkbH-like domain-containing protein [Bradyrhizobium erythrophlei]|uniref:HAD-superfamily phosphatase, subfamily IIIC/FkbH-like domain-containing protein n=1 Tax=Bradyrhizobium erythrophlei TaxID=1437360 RepID=A0A1M5V9S6_9BRAD|nr:HAD-superfamily phosphatase, subfamily IIIC/FkbH-like domain-containing protein [Bradyrhizobium erythrophlei]
MSAPVSTNHAARIPLQALPWLPRPAGKIRDRIASLPAEPLEALLFLQSLAQAAWGEADLRLLGRKISAILKSAPANFAAETRKHGLAQVRILILSASTASHISDALIGTAIRFKFLLDVTVAEYEEPEPWLERNSRELKENPPDFVLVASDSRMLKLASPLGDETQAAQTVEAAIARISRIAEVAGVATGRPVILQTLADDPDAIQFNMDLGLPGSPRFLTHEFNRRLVQQARQDSRLVLDVNALAGLVGQSAWSAGRYWYAAKYPFATGMIPLYADNVMRILAAQMGRSRRVLVLDLDNTMWGGIVGDDGIEGLALGNGSALGEAHAALQRMALSLKERGIILCVSSKNDEAIALDAFRNHPEMILKEDDIVAFRVNWDDKAANIKAIADAIDLGLDAFVFLDDNPAERKRVRDALPSVAVPELPEDPSDWLPVFQAARYFEQAGFSKEDRLRAGFYKANALRAAQMERIGDHDDYLRSLGMTLSIAPFDNAGRKRITQLISKSNQFNLTTRRYSEAEIAAMQSNADIFTLQARLEDIFGDNGMISAVICRQAGRRWEVDTWIMSCRVLGRRVEEAILQHLVEQARSRGITEIVGRYIPTAKNGLVRDHFSRLGFVQTDSQDGETTWQLAVGSYADKDLPLRTDPQRELKLASAGGS